ncbi:MAG: GNAT family N-acetyltransferase [Oscillospiraceae bacterium]|nr:GNAT family N-acetyltransferase [Oscillospiraceae bacterium]
MKSIVLPSVEYRTAFYKMAYDYREIGDRRYYKDIVRDGFDFEVYVTLLHRYSLGINLEEGLVPYTTYWLVDGGKDTIFGVSRLRHKLNKVSVKEGGHIGYDVPPSHRGSGNATELLRQTLLKARAMGMLRVLLTCDAENRASARVIEKNGGALENQVISDYTRKIVNRYWIYC